MAYVPVKYEKVCICCGKEFVAHHARRLFCTKICKNAFYNYENGRSPNRNPGEIEKICVVCGAVFFTRREAVVTCSTECSKRWHNSHGKPTQKKQCAVCGREFETANESRKTCGAKECVGTYRADKEKRRKHGDPRPHAIKSITKTCEICGNVFNDYPNGTIKTCSKECSRLLRKRRDSERRRGRDKRIPKSQRVDRIPLKALYRRDNGKCYICGGECNWSDWNTSKNGNKYPGNTYPTKDHVYPISKGGLDSWENVRLAHWKCNLEKSDGIIKMQPMSRTFAYSEKNSSSGKKKTEQYSLDGELIKVWDSTADIRRELGLNDGRIQDVCRGANKTGHAFGYIWKYAV